MAGTGTPPCIELKDACKSYKDHVIFRSIDLTINQGEIVGLIGPNGAGKTTLLKVLSGMSSLDTGSVLVMGKDPKRNVIDCGLMLENPPFVDSLSGLTNLKILSRIRKRITTNDIEDSLEYVGLNRYDTRTVKKYSLGMRQRLGLAQAIMETPEILLLDEPTNGLDPLAIIDFRSIIRELSSKGVTAVISSHYLSEMAAICDRIFIIMNGSITETNGGEKGSDALEAIYVEHAKKVQGAIAS